MPEPLADKFELMLTKKECRDEKNRLGTLILRRFIGFYRLMLTSFYTLVLKELYNPGRNYALYNPGRKKYSGTMVEKTYTYGTLV